MTKLVRIKLDATFEWDRELSGIPAGIDVEPLAMHLGQALHRLGAVKVLRAWREIGIVEEKPVKYTNAGRMKHGWRPTPEGYACSKCGVRKLPPKKEDVYAKARFITVDGLDRNWIGACPGPSSPRQSDPQVEKGNGT